jgi:hypothetical protein
MASAIELQLILWLIIAVATLAAVWMAHPHHQRMIDKRDIPEVRPGSLLPSPPE